MVLGHLPFCKPCSSDTRYKYFINNKLERFWEIVTSRNEESSEISENFKDLVSMMLSPNPFDRPSLSEVLQHEWFNGETATLEEVQDEFS
eukprot:CAMPEP_0168346300 /NCGR_PEP_ID=MMETSP0213-20121227/18168_1 /TAXON_ID=151035 /ORGANISM="Euplotes harpa, Strain FSP1.4" /LENGTH=89 /DNA_ID=CAMNT_0008354883 /DNA_START=606 /DNA_END=871 /DNA_ORIENTATION=-